MKIAVLIPDRGDRPIFLANCLRMLRAQTLQPAHIELVNDAPLSDAVDITWRYRMGYARIASFDSAQDDTLGRFDLVVFIENDDWYHPWYLEYMAAQWVAHGRPDMLGLDHTVYYHIGARRWFVLQHPKRSNAMNTCIVPGLNLNWPVPHDPYVDVFLWLHGKDAGRELRKVVVTPDREYCVGIKHGVGKCGGQNHTDYMHRYVNDDASGAWFRSVVDEESLGFYLGEGKSHEQMCCM